MLDVIMLVIVVCFEGLVALVFDVVFVVPIELVVCVILTGLVVDAVFVVIIELLVVVVEILLPGCVVLVEDAVLTVVLLATGGTLELSLVGGIPPLLCVVGTLCPCVGGLLVWSLGGEG